MRIWIATGVLVLGGLIMAVRSTSPEVIVRERRIEVPVRVEVPVEVPTIVEKLRIETRTIEKPSSTPVAASSPSGTALAHAKMLFLFERTLDLRAEQRLFMEKVLLERQEEIASYQNEILKSGVFRVKEYEAQVKAIQAAYYAKMGEVLDTPQRGRFQSLLEEGRIGDAVMFEIPSTLVVIEG